MADGKLKLCIPGTLHHQLEFFTNKHFVQSDLSQCDFIFYNDFLIGNKNRIFIQDIQLKRTLKNISARFFHTGKKVIVLLVYDYEHQYANFDNLILLRTSLQASKKRENEFVIPYLFECKKEAFPTSKESAAPRVGFCGWTRNRRKILRTFQESTRVRSNFIKRRRFWGGDPHNQELVQSFYENMRTNQFVIAQRGVGNFSMRFYQTLAAGRIPVLVNTDMELPFASEIPWRDFIVFENSEQECLERVVRCHREGKTEEMQTKCAETFHAYLSRDKYFAHLSKHLRKRFLLTDQSYAA